MKTKWLLILCFAAGSFLRGAETFDEAVQRATLEYTTRLREANAELVAAREKIANEKAPAFKRMRAAEDRIIAADGEITRLETADAQAQERRRLLVKDAELVHKNISYLSSVAQDGLKQFEEELAPGQAQVIASQISDLQQQLTTDSSNARIAKNAVATEQFLLGQVRHALGGATAAGSVTLNEDNQVVKGVFAFVGPETYFRADQSGEAGIVVPSHENGTYPVVYLLKQWQPSASADFFQGKPSILLADSTSGKALRLKQTQGNIWDHIQKGGVVAYAILGVGFVSVLLMLQKTYDLRRMGIDQPKTVHAFLNRMATEGPAAAKQHLNSLKSTTRELFNAGLRAHGETKVVLEERLQAVILRERLHFERRLPLLAVIATAAPLMGLLGTVIGMVRTFTLITVFGTGNAGKLASGISEVLVTTELGLLVAIPTLVAHGVISHRIQKNLSLLERYALEFVTTTQVEATTNRESVSR